MNVGCSTTPPLSVTSSSTIATKLINTNHRCRTHERGSSLQSSRTQIALLRCGHHITFRHPLHCHPPSLQNLWTRITLQCHGCHVAVHHLVVIAIYQHPPNQCPSVHHDSIRPPTSIRRRSSSSTISYFSNRMYVFFKIVYRFFYLICTFTYSCINTYVCVFCINTYIYIIFILIHTLT